MRPDVDDSDSYGDTERLVRADGCCGGEVDDTSFDVRADLGQRRRLLVRRIALAAAAVLALASLVATVLGGAVLADRLAWAASVWAVGLVLGWVREAVTGRRLDWRLVVGVAVVVVGVGWQPLVPALTAVALIAERVVRPPNAPAPSAGRSLAPVD
jgi:hypothetical protein